MCGDLGRRGLGMQGDEGDDGVVESSPGERQEAVAGVDRRSALVLEKVLAEREKTLIPAPDGQMVRAGAFDPIELAAKKSGLSLRIGDLRLRIGIGKFGEGGELAEAALSDRSAESGVMIGEVEKGRGSGPFLSHEEQRRFGGQQQERSGGTVTGGVDLMMQTFAMRAVADLIMILQADDEAVARKVRGGCATKGSARVHGLADVIPALTKGLGDVGDRTGEGRKVTGVVPRERAAQLMMKIVGPDAIEAVTAVLLVDQ